MADFQKNVNMYPARGVPGAFASVNPVVSTPLGYIAGEGGVTVGQFCWEDAETDGVVVGTGTGKPLGFVVRDIIYPIYDLGGAQNIVPEGFNVNVHVSGDFFVQVPSAVTKGQKVFVNNTTGALSGGTAGGTVASSTETDWFFATDAEKDGIAIISNHGNTPAVAGGSSGGAATTAQKLATPRTITLTGAVTGSTSFDGSQDVTITTADGT